MHWNVHAVATATGGARTASPGPRPAYDPRSCQPPPSTLYRDTWLDCCASWVLTSDLRAV